jgi:fibronectin-binding autotransporter adhesin
MATRTVSNAGGNWNATATWVGGVVPVAGDDIAFTATSGNLTVNVASAGLVGVNFTNYVGTITFNNTINTNGVLNLGTGGYTQAGANGILLNGTATLTSGGVTWSRPLAFGATNATYTLVGNWTSTGLVTFQGGGTTTFTNNTLNINGSLTQTTAGTYAGTTTIVFGGTGTWSNSSTGTIRNNTTVNTAGTLTISGTVRYDTGTFTYTAGTVTVTGSTLNCILSTTFATSGMTWNNVTLAGTSQTFTLSSNLNIGGILTLSGTTAITLTGNTINTVGLTSTTTATTSGTTTIVFNGTGTWSNSSTGVLRNNTTVSTAGTLTISGNVYYNTGTLTYTTGTVTTTGSTLNIGANTTLNTNGITWNNVTTTGTTTITLSSDLTLTGTLTVSTGTLSFTLGGNTLITTNANIALSSNTTFILPQNLTCINLTSAFNGFLNGNQLSITGNLTINGSNNINQGLEGTTNLVLTGTGTWSSTSIGVVTNNLTINTAGTITISGNVYYYDNTLTYTAGTVVTTGSTLFIGRGASASTIILNTDGISWNNVTTNVTSGATTITLSSNLTVVGDLSLSATTGSITFNGFTLTVSGNLTRTGTSIASGTTNIVLDGTGTWSHASAGVLRNNLTINTAGTITISGTVYYDTGTLTYTAGTVTTTGSTLNISVSTTLATNGMSWNNITTSGTITITLSNLLTATGTMTLGGSVTFATSGFTVGTLIVSAAGLTQRLVSGTTNTITTAFTCTTATDASRVLFRSTTPGSQAILTVQPGVTVDLGFVNATDIDSSLGKTVYSYSGVLSNTLNWSLLPVDVTSSESSFTFVL